MKLGDLAATVGGILQVYILLGKIISDQFNKYKMYEKIMNTLYDFNVEDQYFNKLIVKKFDKSVYAKEINKNSYFIEVIKKNLKGQNDYDNILYNDYNIKRKDIEIKNKSSNNIFTRLSKSYFNLKNLHKTENILQMKNLASNNSENKITKSTTKLHNENLILDSEMILKNINFKQNNNPPSHERLNTESNIFSIDRKNESSPKNSIDKFANNPFVKTFSKVTNTLKNKVFYIELLKKIEHYKKTSNGKLKITYCDILGIILCRKCVKEYKKKFNLLS